MSTMKPGYILKYTLVQKNKGLQLGHGRRTNKILGGTGTYGEYPNGRVWASEKTARKKLQEAIDYRNKYHGSDCSYTAEDIEIIVTTRVVKAKFKVDPEKIYKDKLGSQLNIGDEVVTYESRYAGLVVTKVLKFTPKNIQTGEGLRDSAGVVKILFSARELVNMMEGTNE